MAKKRPPGRPDEDPRRAQQELPERNEKQNGRSRHIKASRGKMPGDTAVVAGERVAKPARVKEVRPTMQAIDPFHR
jgi:hypothetical protein